jgi:plasmid stability protein
MKSITIHNLDDSLEALIRQKAKDEGLSLNRTVKMLLRKALGQEPSSGRDRRAEFAEFCGVWSKADATEYDRNTRELRRVDRQH